MGEQDPLSAGERWSTTQHHRMVFYQWSSIDRRANIHSHSHHVDSSPAHGENVQIPHRARAEIRTSGMRQTPRKYKIEGGKKHAVIIAPKLCATNLLSA